MPVDTKHIEQIVRSVSDEQSFIQNLLIDGLHWEIPTEAKNLGAIAYDWTPEELQVEDLESHLVDGTIKQIVLPNNPWGVFILEFKNPELFATGRGMTGPLRRLLRSLVPKKRGSRPDQPVFAQENLLFICNHDYKNFRFAHFKAPLDPGKAAPLAAFGWGPHDPVRTVCEFNLPALVWPEQTPPDDAGWVECWRAAFDVEKVTKRFYEDYRKTFEAFERCIKGKPDSGGLAGEELRLFTQSLFNRLMFLRFIERKRWLTFPGQRGTNYLSALFEAGGCDGESLFRGRLRPLFFEGLAIEGKQDSPAYGQVPFLNGGLFDETDLDEKVKDIPDEAFEAVLGDEHIGGLFYSYNFTVEESTSLEIEVAVDPEMLGKVFEELVTGRHESGSYYTPRPVVSFMCREALKGHLTNRTQAPDDAVSKLVDDHVVDGLTEAHAQAIVDALDDLKAVDPACGSGAYLLGLLHELIAIRRALQSEKLVADPKFLYELKLHIISHNLYGVDIDPFATEIAKLRLWLSLAVEADDPIALPNLDFKIETGDSLLGPCDSFVSDLRTAALHTMAEGLVADKDAFLKATGQHKADLKAAIDAKLHAIAKELDHPEFKGVVDWRVHFAEVFVRNLGFDIVLANPPYVRQELIKDIKPQLKAVFGDRIYAGTADLYVFFYARSLQLLADGGMLAFISSNKWFRAGYGRKLRKHVSDKMTVLSITDFRDLPVFNAACYAMIFIARKRKPSVSEDDATPTRVLEVESLDPPYPDLREMMRKADDIPWRAMVGERWLLSGGKAILRSFKMEQRSVSLDEYTAGKIFNGIKTGLNECFVISVEEAERLTSVDSLACGLIFPFLQGDSIKRWKCNPEQDRIIYLRWQEREPESGALRDHLESFRDPLQRRDGVHNGSCPWYALSRPRPELFQHFQSPKIVLPDIAEAGRFAFDTSGAFVGNTSYVIASDDMYLLGVLNSSPVLDWYSCVSSQIRGGYLRFIRQYIEQIPIPDASDSERERIAELVRRCLDAGGVDVEEIEREIDERVSRLYGLSPDNPPVEKGGGE